MFLILLCESRLDSCIRVSPRARSVSSIRQRCGGALYDNRGCAIIALRPRATSMRVLDERTVSMCQSDVYVAEGERESLLMKDVSWIEEREGGLLLKDLDGEQKELQARVKYADLVGHRIVLELVSAASMPETGT